MAQTIKLRRSASESAIPTPAALALGEMAINTFDGKIFIKRDNSVDDANVIEIGYDRLPLAGGALTGALTTNSTFDGRDVATDGTKLDGIEASATADQTAAQIKTAYESNSNTNAYNDASSTKLATIETSADVTDATNVTAAGALMDSELTSIASVKALNQGVATTNSPTFAATNLNGSLKILTNGNLVEIADAAVQWYSAQTSDYKVASMRALSYNLKGSGNSSILVASNSGIDVTGALTVTTTATLAGKDVGTQSVVTTAPTSGAGFPTGHVWYVI